MSDPAPQPPTLDYRSPKVDARLGPPMRKVVGWTLGIAGALLLLIVLTLPQLGRARETANRVKCASNLKQIGFAIQLYENENRGELPPDWPTLLATEDLVPEVFTCPSGSFDHATGATTQATIDEMMRGDHLSYLWLGHGFHANQVTPTMVLAYEVEMHVPRDNAVTTGMNVLLGDGSVKFVDEPTAKAIRAQHIAGVRPIFLPTASPTATTKSTAP